MNEKDLKRRFTAAFLLVLSLILFFYFYRIGAEFNPDKRLFTFWNTGVPYGFISRGNQLFGMQNFYIEQDFIFGILLPLTFIFLCLKMLLPDAISAINKKRKP